MGIGSQSRNRHAQSAMEYLMAYGWAILIIAVVLGALFGLGFFNSTNLAPKVGPGSCQVYRPNGPGTTIFINTEGICNNELPQYVAQFDGASSYISTGTSGLPAGSAARSVFAWIYFTGSPSSGTYNIYGMGTQGVVGSMADLQVYQDKLRVITPGGGAGPFAVASNTWSFAGFTYAAGASTVTIYLNGQSSSPFNTGSALNTVAVSEIGRQGATGCGCNYFQGQIADVQVYNTSLSANEVTALYDEGIGGDPLVLSNLVGWWPLNGNADDYSGNLNNGVPTGVIYTGSWTSGYSAP